MAVSEVGLHPGDAYIPQTPIQERIILDAIGVHDPDELFADIPPELRNPSLNLPPGLTEMDLAAEMQAFADRNVRLPSFLGYGTYDRFQPAVVRAIIGRDEFLTSYTPYQPEVSQGTLTVAFEFQTMMANLYDMGVSNTGMYDGASAMAEAALMAARLKPGKNKVVALDGVHPNWLEVTKTYLGGKGIDLVVVEKEGVEEAARGAAGVIVQSPNYLGSIEDLASIGKTAHAQGALFIVSADPISLGLYKPPGYFDADIAVGEGQSLGHRPNLGGVNLGIFTARMEHVRQMPGRIVGRTNDQEGRTGYVLTLQPREQHIRRERATSNICTAEQLIATASTVYLAALGERGLMTVAERNYLSAHYLASELANRGFNVDSPDGGFFNEFVVECSCDPAEVNKRLLESGFIGGKDVSHVVRNGMLLCATETANRVQMDKFVEAFSKAA